jgi:thiamine phosphate synthase YjbQ (UPF0047 family)
MSLFFFNLNPFSNFYLLHRYDVQSALCVFFLPRSTFCVCVIEREREREIVRDIYDLFCVLV